MRFFVIPPIKHMDLALEGTAGIYCLAHLYLQHKDYRQFFLKQREQDVHVLLDNSAAEKALIDQDRLIEIVKELNPHLVVAPDHLFDAKKTIEEFHSFVDRMKQEELLDTKIFACPQGNTKEEWLECYQEMVNEPLVRKIGLSKISVPKAFLGECATDQGILEGRHLCVDYLKEHNLLVKPIHCLGMGDPREYSYYKDIPMIETTDSCYTVLAAYNGVDFSNGDFRRIPTPHEYFDYKLSDEQLEVARKNIAWMKKNV